MLKTLATDAKHLLMVFQGLCELEQQTHHGVTNKLFLAFRSFDSCYRFVPWR